MSFVKIFGGLTALLTLIWNISVAAVLGVFTAYHQGMIKYDPLRFNVAENLFYSQYFADSTINNIPRPIRFECDGGRPTIDTHGDPYHVIIGSDTTAFYTGGFFFLNLIWAFFSILVMAECCCAKGIDMIKGWLWISIVPLLLHLVITIMHLTALAYPISLLDCLDYNSDSYLDLVTSELIFPIVYSGGFLGWISLTACWAILFCLVIREGRKPKKESRNIQIIHAHGESSSAMCMNPIGVENDAFHNEGEDTIDDQTRSRHSSGDIYSRRSSRAAVKRNVHIGSSDPHPILYTEANRVLPPTYHPSSTIGTQTVSDIGTQTMSILDSSRKQSHISDDAQLIFTRSKPGESRAAPSGGKVVKFPPQPPPLPMPNFSESSPDQPWKLILRNLERSN